MDVANDYNLMENVDKEKLANLDIYSSFDYEDEFNNYILLLLTEKPMIDKYKIILYNNIIPNVTRDISDIVINFKIDLLEDIEKYRNRTNKQKLNNFKQNVEFWIESNLELDKILDMINEKGVEWLKPLHKNFLKKI
jgi:hypothetical protein